MRKHIMLAVPVLIAVLAGSAVGVNATDDTGPDDTELDGLVTEEVEPGINASSATAPVTTSTRRTRTYRYDMDDVFVTADGTIWLSCTYSRRQRGQPWGGLLWALGEPGMFQSSPNVSAAPSPERRPLGVICVDPATETRRTTYLVGTLDQRGCGRSGRHRLGRGRLRRRKRWPVSHHSGLFHIRRPAYHLTESLRACNQRRPGRSNCRSVQRPHSCRPGERAPNVPAGSRLTGATSRARTACRCARKSFVEVRSATSQRGWTSTAGRLRPTGVFRGGQATRRLWCSNEPSVAGLTSNLGRRDRIPARSGTPANPLTTKSRNRCEAPPAQQQPLPSHLGARSIVAGLAVAAVSAAAAYGISATGLDLCPTARPRVRGRRRRQLCIRRRLGPVCTRFDQLEPLPSVGDHVGRRSRH